jgi:hypothetical protein
MTEEFLMKRPSRERWPDIFTSTCALASVAALLAGCGESKPPPQPCRTAEIPEPTSELGNEVFVGTIASENLFESSCGKTNAPERVFTWSAPVSGWYSFDTFRSNLDTILSVWNGDVCDSTELACNNDYEPFLQSYIVVRLEAGEMVYLVVEGDGSTAGQFVINIHALREQECADTQDNDKDGLIDCADPDCDCPCPNGTLNPMLDQPFSASTAGGHDLGAGSCGGEGAPDDSLVWIPPSTGRYRIETTDSTFDTVLYVRQGEMCGGAEIACNDDDILGVDLSAVELPLDGGVPVIITVDGFDGSQGNYVLDITLLYELDCSNETDDDGDGKVDCHDADCDCTCPSQDLGSMRGPQVATGSTGGRPDLDAGSCGGDGAPDASFVWTAPSDGAFRIDTEGSMFDTVLYAQEGNVCGGTEIACNGLTSEILLVLALGEPVVIIVDGYLDESGEFTLNIADVTEAQESSCADGYDTDADGAVDCADDDCAQPCRCPMDNLDNALGEPVVTGNTVLRGNRGSSTCGGNSAPDAGFAWTAPQTATYRIHTNGSSFDTVLYVQEGDACGGPELVCDDDTHGSQSQVVLNLTAGETVVITVDGFFGDDAGDFALNIECLTCP